MLLPQDQLLYYPPRFGTLWPKPRTTLRTCAKHQPGAVSLTFTPLVLKQNLSPLVIKSHGSGQIPCASLLLVSDAFSAPVWIGATLAVKS